MGEFRLGKYQLLVELARGGMGIVYLAVAHGPGGFSKLLIIKELKPELVDDATFLAMFLEEARLAARLEHPNIVQTIEVGQEGYRHYIAMEYLQGQPLSRIRRRRPAGFTMAAELRVISEILHGLHYAHTLKDYDGSAAHVIHRDVSPQNVFVTYDGQAKIVDFGIAKAADSVQETQAGMFKGKAAYVAPEQVTGAVVDPRSDVFAAGVMLWEAVAGHRLWNNLNDIEILKRLLKRSIPDVRSARPDVPEELARIVDKAIAWKLEDRHESAEALAMDIDAYLAEKTRCPTLRDIGDSVEKAFAAEREQLRRVVEPQLAALKQRSPVTAIPSLPRLVAADGPNTGQSASSSVAAQLASGMIATDLASEQPILTRSTQQRRPLSRAWIALGSAAVPIGVAATLLAAHRRPAADATADRGAAVAMHAPEIAVGSPGNPRQPAATPQPGAAPSPAAPQAAAAAPSAPDDDAPSTARRESAPRRTFRAFVAPPRAPAANQDAAPAAAPPPPAPPTAAPPPAPASATAAEKARVRIVEDPQRVKIVD
ncbi:MAG TPA: serine/threonine-protein kinase [Polyangiaceae bacterium]|nr:serine/threonine-protein kinase [Polyangiaceae bacterium]